MAIWFWLFNNSNCSLIWSIIMILVHWSLEQIVYSSKRVLMSDISKCMAIKFNYHFAWNWVILYPLEHKMVRSPLDIEIFARI